MDFDFDPFDGDIDWFDAVIIGSCIDSLAAEEFEDERRRREMGEEPFPDLDEADWDDEPDDDAL